MDKRGRPVRYIDNSKVLRYLNLDDESDSDLDSDVSAD